MNKKQSSVWNITAAAAACALALGGCAAPASAPGVVQVQNVDSTSDTITVSGKEEVKTVPDMAEIIYAIHSQDTTAEACQQANAKSLDAAIQTLKGLGVEESSIQTSSFGLTPIQNWSSPNQEITGYEMDTQLTVSNIPIDQVGSLLSETVAAGVNGIESVNYFSSAYDANYQEALKGAIANAQAKANAIAEASGRTILAISHVEEYGYNDSVRYSAFSGNARTAADSAPGVPEMAVMPGEIRIEAQVSVDFKLQ